MAKRANVPLPAHYKCDALYTFIHIEVLNIYTCHQWSSSPCGFFAVTPDLNHKLPLVSSAHAVLFSPRAIQMGSKP